MFTTIICRRHYTMFNLFFIHTSFKVRSSDQVLPRDNGVRYPWNFIFKKSFWRSKSTIKNHSSLEAKRNDKHFKKRFNAFGKNNSEPAVEAISLDMKQQELDGRLIYLNFSMLWIYMQSIWVVSLQFYIWSVDAFRLGICIRCMLLRRVIAVPSTHYSSPCMKIRFLLFLVGIFIGVLFPFFWWVVSIF